MIRRMSKKEFSEKKKQLEKNQRIEIIKKHGGDKIYQMFMDGEVTEREAYEHSKSEMLGVEGVKSKGNKTYVTSSKINTSVINSNTKINPLGEFVMFDTLEELKLQVLQDLE